VAGTEPTSIRYGSKKENSKNRQKKCKFFSGYSGFFQDGVKSSFFEGSVRMDRNRDGNAIFCHKLLIYFVRSGLPDKDEPVFLQDTANFFAAKRWELIH
jgi:hypothetical protein